MVSAACGAAPAQAESTTLRTITMATNVQYCDLLFISFLLCESTAVLISFFGRSDELMIPGKTRPTFWRELLKGAYSVIL
jgi:hypothetical protein